MNDSKTILINGELDQWADGKPVGWEIGQGVAAFQDAEMRISGTAAIRMYPERTQADISNSSSISQEVKLKPNTKYQLKFWAAKDASGDVRAYVIPRGAAPVLEYISGWADFFVFTEISCAFETTEATDYTVRLIHYGHPGNEVWLDAVTLAPVKESADAPSATTTGGPVRLFAQSYMIPFDNKQLDDTAVETNRFVVQAARNEYVPLLVAIGAQRDLKSVDLRLVGDLKSDSGQTLGNDQVVIRSHENGVLPLTHPRAVSSGQHLAWWLTVKPNPERAAGTYSGKLQVVENGKVISEGKLVVELLDLVLPKPDASFFLWHHDGYFRPEHLTPELQQAYYQDMADHGMTTVTIYGSPEADDGKIDFSKNLGYQNSGSPPVMAWGYDKAVPGILKAGLASNGQPIILLITREAHGGRPGYDFGAASESVTRSILDEWFKRDWPTPLLYVYDEPSNKERIDAVRPVLERIKSWKLPVKTVTAGLDIPALGHLYDMWIQIQFDINLETIMAAREHKAELWTYDCRVPYTNAPFNRAMYGFWAYRAGIKGVGRWAYHDTTATYIDDQEVMHGGVGPRLSHVIPSSKGPVPTVAWEAAREGVDDYRTLMLYDTTIKDAKEKLASLQSKYSQLLTEAEIKTLIELEKRKRTKFQEGESPIVWNAGTSKQTEGEKVFLAAYRLEHTLEMAKTARKKVVESIPVDAMAVAGAIPFMGVIETLFPPLGFGDPRTIAETKRRALIGYLQRLRAAAADEQSSAHQ